MTDPQPSRRSVLKTGVTLGGLAAVGSLSGCTGLLGGDSGGGKVESVPGGVTTVAYADVNSFLADETVRESLNEQISTLAAEGGSDTPDSVEAALDRIESEVGLDPRALNELVVFGEVGNADSFGVVVWTDWAEDDLVAAAEQSGTQTTASTYGDKTVYEGGANDDNWIGVLGEGRYALGTETAVKDTIDVENGDADPVGGAVRSAYENAASGYVRFAFEVPTQLVPDESSGQVDVSVFDSVETGYGSIGTGDAAFRLTLTATDADSAGNVADVIDGGLVTFRDQIESNPPSGQTGEQLVDTLLGAIENTDVSQDGSNVVVTNQGSVGDIVAVVGAVLGSFVLGLGDDVQESTPVASFSFDYDGSARTVEITHDGGDTIRASNLYVTGTGFVQADGVDMAASGRWRGSTNSSIDGEPAVSAGDRVTVGFRSDGELRLVYRDGDTSATLAAYSGPDA